MSRWQPIAFVAFVFIWASAWEANGATMTFDDLDLGTVFGTPNEEPGFPVYDQDGIVMSVEEIIVEGAAGFLRAEVGGRYGDFFPTHSLDLNNISVSFDFREVGFAVNQVSLEFIELGPLNNFSVNDADLFELYSLQLIPTEVAPGVTAVVTDGVITLTGDIEEMLVGGQELAIDTVFAIPEPATLLLVAVGGTALVRSRRRRSS